MTDEISLNVGDIIPVEIAGQTIGDAHVSEITDEYIEVVWRGYTFKISPDAMDFLDLKSAVDSIG